MSPQNCAIYAYHVAAHVQGVQRRMILVVNFVLFYLAFIVHTCITLVNVYVHESSSGYIASENEIVGNSNFFYERKSAGV